LPDISRDINPGAGRGLSRVTRRSRAARGITSITTMSSATLVGGIPVLHGSLKFAKGNDDGVRAARDAIAILRSAFPELAWRTPGAVPVPELRTGQRTATLIILLLLAVRRACQPAYAQRLARRPRGQPSLLPQAR
jgi:hypothetical protein